MKHDYMHMECQRTGVGFSKNPMVMVKLPLVSVDMIKIVKGTFISLSLVYILVHLIMLMLE